MIKQKAVDKSALLANKPTSYLAKKLGLSDKLSENCALLATDPLD